jgi:hypothetical protein
MNTAEEIARERQRAEDQKQQLLNQEAAACQCLKGPKWLSFDLFLINVLGDQG